MHRNFRTAAAAIVAMICLGLAPTAQAQKGKLPGTKSGFVTTADGVKIHYLEAGKGTIASVTDVDKTNGSYSRKECCGPTILFVPGWTMPADIWEHQIAYFSKTYRVVAMDPRGQGDSSKPSEGYYPAARARDIKAVVDQLKLEPVVLVGWSMGVTELAAYVDQFGTDTIAALVLVDGIAGGDLDPKISLGMFNFAGTFVKDRAKNTDGFVRFMYKKPQSEEYIKRIVAASLKTPTNTAAALFLGTFTTDNRPALAKMNKPTLIVAAGDEKNNLWMAQYAEMQKRIAGARLEKFTDCGHALFVDDPARFNSLLDAFLAAARQSSTNK